MMHKIRPAALALIGLACVGLACAGLASMPATAQPLPKSVAPAPPANPQIGVAYAPPQDERYREIYQRLKDLQVLETLQQFLSPLKLPHKIEVKTEQCNARRLLYAPGGPVVICYEYILAIEQLAPAAPVAPIAGGRIAREGVIVGAFVNEVLSEVTHAVFDVLRIPVWGNADDAADSVAALIMTQFGNAVAWRTLMGTSWFLAQSSYIGRGSFSEVLRPSEATRFYNYLCIAYAANPEDYAFLREDIPTDRLDWCMQDYLKLVRSFKQTILPHIDQNLLRQVRAVDWMTRLKMTRG